MAIDYSPYSDPKAFMFYESGIWSDPLCGKDPEEWFKLNRKEDEETNFILLFNSQSENFH